MESPAKTLKQMLREFWLPFVVAIVWTAYVIWTEPANLKTIITAFGPAFFLASWMTGQFFRVRKQAILSKYFRRAEHAFPLLVLEPEVGRISRIDDYTPLYRRFENEIGVTRVFCRPDQLAEARTLL